MSFRYPMAIACLLFLCVGASAQFRPGFVQNEVLVKFASSAGSLPGMANRQIGATALDRLASVGVVRLRLRPGMNVSAAVNFYRSLPFVEFAEPNFYAYAGSTPNDADYDTQWALTKIQALEGWAISESSSNIIIAIVDTGVDLSHPDLAAKITHGYNFVSDNTSAHDDNGHGTHCAGIAAAITGNGIGIAGVAPNASIMPIKVLGADGSGTYSNVANGIIWAADNGARVISLSLGGPSHSASLQNAVNYAWNKGVVLVAAAGNAGNTNPSYPAYYTNVISVASTNSDDTRSSFSTYGSWVTVAAPGAGIYSTYPRGYGWMSGTSMATPHVAGQAALLWTHFGAGATNTQVRQRIESTGDPVGSWVSKGRINVLKSLQPPPPESNPEPDVNSATLTQLDITSGEWVAGALSSLLETDGDRFIIAGAPAGRQNLADLYASAQLEYGGTLKRLDISMTCSSSLAGGGSVFLWNWTRSRWERVGMIRYPTTEAVRIIRRSRPQAYVSPTGELLLRIQRPSRLSHPFTMSFDSITIVPIT